MIIISDTARILALFLFLVLHVSHKYFGKLKNFYHVEVKVLTFVSKAFLPSLLGISGQGNLHQNLAVE